MKIIKCSNSSSNKLLDLQLQSAPELFIWDKVFLIGTSNWYHRTLDDMELYLPAIVQIATLLRKNVKVLSNPSLYLIISIADMYTFIWHNDNDNYHNDNVDDWDDDYDNDDVTGDDDDNDDYTHKGSLIQKLTWTIRWLNAKET